MPSFLFMKVLESTPERYDRGIMIISRGRIQEVYDEISSEASGEGLKILDLGCGTGNLSTACATKGAYVTGIDINSGMLEVARRKGKERGLEEQLKFLEIGVAEVGSKFDDEEFDSCVSCLAFSELTEDEQKYAISVVYSKLKSGGILIIADEVKPVTLWRRFLRGVTAFPLKLLAYILTQSTTRPLEDITPIFKAAGFANIRTERMWNDSFMIIKATKGEKK